MKKHCRVCKREVPWMVRQGGDKIQRRLRTGVGTDIWNLGLASDENDVICLPCLENLKSECNNDDWKIRITLN